MYCKRYKETKDLMIIRITATEYYQRTKMRGEALVAGAGVWLTGQKKTFQT